MLCAGCIENWRLGDGGDDIKISPYFKPHDDSPNFNRLFAALYDVIFTKLTKMGRLIPGPGRTLKEIFKEKIYGTDKHVISEELVAYLMWLIYIAAFKDRSNVPHEVFYNTKVAYLRSAALRWRTDLYIKLAAWYEKYPPSKKRSRSSGATVVDDVGEFVRAYKIVNLDEFVDPLQDDDPPPQRGGALSRDAAAASGALAAAAASGADGGAQGAVGA